MISSPRFIIDSNILIESHRLDYDFDICPGFWDLMNKAFEAGIVIGHKKVLDELLGNEDALSEWLAGIDKDCFPKETEEELDIYLQLSKWARSREFTGAAIEEFETISYADPWICAKAKQLGVTLVTQEVSEPKAKARVKLPDACIAIGVNYCNKYVMLRELKARFELSASHAF